MNKKWWHFFTLLLIQLAIMFCIHKKGVGYISAIVYNLFVLSYCFVFVRADYSSKLLTASKQITGLNIFYQFPEESVMVLPLQYCYLLFFPLDIKLRSKNIHF